jgi:hypothetical protein
MRLSPGIANIIVFREAELYNQFRLACWHEVGDIPALQGKRQIKMDYQVQLQMRLGYCYLKQDLRSLGGNHNQGMLRGYLPTSNYQAAVDVYRITPKME